jgi:hypothetical protein
VDYSDSLTEKEWLKVSSELMFCVWLEQKCCSLNLFISCKPILSTPVMTCDILTSWQKCLFSSSCKLSKSLVLREGGV